MQNLQRNRNHSRNESKYMVDRIEILLSDGLSLVHDQTVQEGKTRDMAKGLFLCWRGKLCAGESAGLGVPVWKTGHQTVFPTLTSVKSIGKTSLEKEFCMNRILVWHLAGRQAPAWFSKGMEKLVNEYMKRTALQNHLLKIRDIVYKLCRLHSTMAAGPETGHCKVFYETMQDGLNVHVDGSSIQGQGQLIVLNEVDARSFNHLRIDNRIWKESEIPAWQSVPFNAQLQSPLLGLGISVTPGGSGDPSCYSLYCGREVALEIDWAGLAITNEQSVFTYQIQFTRLRGWNKS